MGRVSAAVLRIAIDQQTRERIRGSLRIDPDGAIDIRLPHRLQSPNKSRGAHWSTRADERKAWETRLMLVIGDAAKRSSVGSLGYLTPKGRWIARPLVALGLEVPQDKRIVRIERQVPSSRNFIKDDDNLAFCAKGLVDSLRALGFVRDDSAQWTELHITQRVSEDLGSDGQRRDWTCIRIEIPR